MESQGRKKSSKLWEHFESVHDAHKLATCKHCKQLLSYKSTVSNLRKHLERRHRNVKIPTEASSPVIKVSDIKVEKENPDEQEMQVDATNETNGEISVSPTNSNVPLPIKKETVVDETCLGSVVSCATSVASAASASTSPNSTPAPPASVPSLSVPVSLPNDVPSSETVENTPKVVSSEIVENIPKVVSSETCVNPPKVVSSEIPENPPKVVMPLSLTSMDDSVFYDFGKSVGIYLTKLPLERALISKEKIHTLLTQEYLSALRSSSVESYSAQPHTYNHVVSTSYTIATPDTNSANSSMRISENSAKSCSSNANNAQHE